MGACPVALLKRRLKLRSGIPETRAACSMGLATEKWRLEPALRFVNRGVAMIGHRLEYDIGRKTIGMPLKREELRHGLSRRRSRVLGNQIKNEIVPRGGGAGHEKLLMFSGGDQRPVQPQPHVGEIAAKRRRVHPVNRRIFAVEQTGLREQQHARAGGAQLRSRSMHIG